VADEDLTQELERLRRENEALRKRSQGAVRLQVSAKGGVSLYGLRRFPITFYAEEWERILALGDEIRTFLAEHEAELKKKAKG
jgi:hypothetical protein